MTIKNGAYTDMHSIYKELQNRHRWLTIVQAAVGTNGQCH